MARRPAKGAAPATPSPRQALLPAAHGKGGLPEVVQGRFSRRELQDLDKSALEDESMPNYKRRLAHHRRSIKLAEASRAERERERLEAVKWEQEEAEAAAELEQLASLRSNNSGSAMLPADLAETVASVAAALAERDYQNPDPKKRVELDPPKVPAPVMRSTAPNMGPAMQPRLTRQASRPKVHEIGDTCVDLSQLGLNDLNAQSALSSRASRKTMVLKRLDLRGNRLRFLTKDLLGRAEQSLCWVDLSKNNIGDPGAVVLLQGLARYGTIRSLVLADNAIAGRDLRIFKLLRDCQALHDLDLSWNAMTAKSLGAFATILDAAAPGALHDLNLSRNNRTLATSASERAAEARHLGKLGQALADNLSLAHLDLSHNALGTAAIRALGDGLLPNRTLLGLHLVGNMGRVDARGFVVPLEQIDTGNFRTNCWVCECWVPTKIKWKHVVEHDFVQTAADAANATAAAGPTAAPEPAGGAGSTASVKRGGSGSSVQGSSSSSDGSIKALAPEEPAEAGPESVQVHLPQFNWLPWELHCVRRNPRVESGQLVQYWETTVTLPARSQRILFHFTVDGELALSDTEPIEVVRGKVLSDDLSQVLGGDEEEEEAVANRLDWSQNDFYERHDKLQLRFPRMTPEESREMTMRGVFHSWGLRKSIWEERARRWPSASFMEFTKPFTEKQFELAWARATLRARELQDLDQGAALVLRSFFEAHFVELVDLFRHASTVASATLAEMEHSAAPGLVALCVLLSDLGIAQRAKELEAYESVLAPLAGQQMALEEPWEFITTFGRLALAVTPPKRSEATPVRLPEACEMLWFRVKQSMDLAQLSPDRFRSCVLYTEDVDEWISAHRDFLLSVFHECTGAREAGAAPFVDQDQFVAFARDKLGLLRLTNVRLEDVLRTFRACIPLGAAEAGLCFTDFVEAFARLAVQVPLIPDEVPPLSSPAEIFGLFDATDLWRQVRYRGSQQSVALEHRLEHLFQWTRSLPERLAVLDEQASFWEQFIGERTDVKAEVLRRLGPCEEGEDPMEVRKEVHRIGTQIFQRTRGRTYNASKLDSLLQDTRHRLEINNGRLTGARLLEERVLKHTLEVVLA